MLYVLLPKFYCFYVFSLRYFINDFMSGLPYCFFKGFNLLFYVTVWFFSSKSSKFNVYFFITFKSINNTFALFELLQIECKIYYYSSWCWITELTFDFCVGVVWESSKHTFVDISYSYLTFLSFPFKSIRYPLLIVLYDFFWLFKHLKSPSKIKITPCWFYC